MSKNSFHMVLLPKAPLIGIGLLNDKIMRQDEKIYQMYGIEIGILFARFSFIRIGGQIS